MRTIMKVENAKITKASLKVAFAFGVNILIMIIVAKNATTETANHMQSFTFLELDATTQITAWLRYRDEVNQLAKPRHRDATVQEARAELNRWRFTEHGERIA